MLGKTRWLELKREPTEDAKKIWIIAPIPRQYKKKVKVIENDEEIEKAETYLKDYKTRRQNYE